jgi:CRP-like cAMP-binding protein
MNLDVSSDESPHGPYRNALLSAVSRDIRASVEADCGLVQMKLGEVLWRPSRPIEFVFFPLSGMISLMQRLKDGAEIEVGLIGNEGFLGAAPLLGARTSLLTAMVQGDGKALRMSREKFLQHLAASSGLRDTLLLFVQALYTQATQTAACNSRHLLPQRLARWILEAHDRMGQPVLPLTHSFLSRMLGIRRAGVTVALGEFAERGLVETHRGHVVVCNREGLKEATCECYPALRAEYEKLLPGILHVSSEGTHNAYSSFQ